MAKLPCIIKAPCPDDANPFENLSSEDPDINRFFAYGSGPGRITPGNPSGPGGNGPPPGFNWNTNCNTADGPITCAATSLEEALLCVARLGQLCAGDPDDPNTPEDPSTPDGQPAFYSTLQECAALCPDGNLFLFQVAAGAFVGSSQILADRMALSYACRQAELSRICFGTLSRTAACTGTSFSGTIRVTTSFALVSVQVIGGSLPPGITMSNSASTILFSGTPTTPGNYTFTIRAVNNRGNFMIKSFTIYVLGFTNAAPTDYALDVPYNFQFTGDGGTAPLTFSATGLPAGLTMDANGLITGQSSVAGDTDFTVTMTDEDGRTCTKNYSLTGVNQAAFKICDFTHFVADLTNPGCPASAFPAWDGIFNLETVFNDGNFNDNPMWYFLSQSLFGQAVAPDDGAPNYPNGNWQANDTFIQLQHFKFFGEWVLNIFCVSGNLTWGGFLSSADENDPSGTYVRVAGSSAGPASVVIKSVDDVCCPDWDALVWDAPTFGNVGAGTSAFTPNFPTPNAFVLEADAPDGASDIGFVQTNGEVPFSGEACSCNLHVDMVKISTPASQTGNTNGLIQITLDVGFIVPILTASFNVTTNNVDSFDFPFDLPSNFGSGTIRFLVRVRAPGIGVFDAGQQAIELNAAVTNV